MEMVFIELIVTLQYLSCFYNPEMNNFGGCP